MRKKVVAGNWKMNLSWDEADMLASHVASGKAATNEVILAVPFVYVKPLADKFGKTIGISAQDCSAHTSGAYTGEVSAAMLASVRATHCLVGHSERRQYHAESDDILAEKTNRLLEQQVQPIFCCGERIEQRKQNEQLRIVSTQLEKGMFHLDAEAISSCLIAYEPVWAIGTGVTALPAQAQEMHAWIRELVARRYSASVAEAIRIVYGGSVTPVNAKELFACPDVDGGLVGGASLKANDFIQILIAASGE